MFTATFNGKTLNEIEIELLELVQAREALKLLKSGREFSKIFNQDEIDETDNTLKEWFAVSDGKFKSTDLHIKGTGLTAEEFLKEFYGMIKDQPTMLAANPSHFCLTDDLSNVHLLEIAGGKATEAFLKFDNDFLKDANPSPGYPHQMVARGYSGKGDPTLGVLHEFKTTDEGFEGILGIYFPIAADESALNHHREHLVVEFHNWYRFAMERLGRKDKL